ncbi:MAG: shikimate dehydrogenase, partial [Thermomicrobiales bacterium]
RAAVLALDAMGAPRILVVNRDLARAEQLVADLGVEAARAATYEETSLEQALPDTDVLVNATSLGWRAGEMPLPSPLLDLLPQRAVVFDMTYRDTDLLQAATARGLIAADGLAMLVHQGARAFALFTGRDAPVQVMLQAAQAARDGAA